MVLDLAHWANGELCILSIALGYAHNYTQVTNANDVAKEVKQSRSTGTMESGEHKSKIVFIHRSGKYLFQ